MVKSKVHVGNHVSMVHIDKPRHDVVLSDILRLSISCPYEVAQDKSAWRAQTYSIRT